MFFKIQKLNSGVYPAKSRMTRWNGGFTLIELLVVITIATIVTTALVIQQNRWNDRLTVSTQAYELALMVRQAQIYSLGVREDLGGVGDKFNIGYGVFVDASSPTQFVFFADRDKDFVYDGGENLQSESKTLTRGVTIDKICANGIFTGIEWCSDTFLGSLLVSKYQGSFKRPDTYVHPIFLNIINLDTTSLLAPQVKIYLQSKGGRQSLVTIESTGYVSIDDL